MGGLNDHGWKFLLTASEDGSFTGIENPAGEDGKIRYQAAVTGAGKTVEIDVHNNLRVIDPWTSRPQIAGMAQLAVIFQTAEGSQLRIPLLLVGPPYRWVEVHFSVDANGKAKFEYAQDIDIRTHPPSISSPRDGAVYFTLTGAEFDREEPFDFDVPASDSCIVDVGTNGKEAILTDLHADSENPQGHSFHIQVIDESGKRYRSEDPTIVNVSASEPPIGGTREA